jgi:hypothetical protein
MAKTQTATVTLSGGKTATLTRKDGVVPTVDIVEVAKNPNAALPPTGNAEFVKTQ